MSNERPQDFIQSLASFTNAVTDLLQRFAAGVEAFNKRVEEVAPVIMQGIVQAHANVQRLPDRLVKLQRNLAERGWYVLPQFTLTPVNKLEDDFAAQRMDAADDTMILIVEHYLDEIESELKAQLPHRAAIIEEAFDAHRNGKYASSITLLLTQADGICFDMLGKMFFIRDHGSPSTRQAVEALQLNVYAQMLLEPLMTSGGVSARDQELGQYPDSLHRHQILHGKETSYPSKLNSLKAISLVGYLGGLAKGIIDEAQATNAAGSAAAPVGTT